LLFPTNWILNIGQFFFHFPFLFLGLGLKTPHLDDKKLELMDEFITTKWCILVWGLNWDLFSYFIGPCPHKDMDYRIASKFCNFYLIRTCFTLGEQVYLIEMSRLFKSKQIFWCSECEQSSGIGQWGLGFGGQQNLGFKKRSYGSSCCCKDFAFFLKLLIVVVGIPLSFSNYYCKLWGIWMHNLLLLIRKKIEK